MRRKHFTVALHNLPRDIKKPQLIHKLNRIALNKECRFSIGPLVNRYGADRNHVISCSTTVALQGSGCESVVSKIEGLQIASDTSQQEVHVDRSFHGITSLAEIEDSTIDVYNIHGLGGHAFESWACDIDDKNPATIKAWPRDFLPQQFKRHGLKARFATIGYNANVVGNVDVTGTIRSAAENLLSQLIADRPKHSEASKRPMYFICHSLGGLVLCEAIIILLSGREEFENLASGYQYLFVHNEQCLLKGISFFGTPFQGSTKANQISPFVTALAKINPFPTNPRIVNELKNVHDGSSRLDDISEAANIIMVRYGIQVLVACETQPVNGTGRTPVTERESALGIFNDRVIAITINGDHIDMVKFKHEGSDYGVFSSRLIQMVKDTDPTFDPSQALPEVARDDDSILEPRQPIRVQTAPPATVGAAGNQTIINITGGFGYQWDAEGDFNFSNNPGRDGGNSPNIRSRYGGSPGPVAEQSNSQSPNQQSRDSTPVPPDIRRLHVRSDTTVPTQSSLDGSEYSRLGIFDTVFIIDDTLSMDNPVHSDSTGQHQMSRWGMLERSLEYIVNITTTHDKDGVDVQFLKNPELNGQNIRDPNVFLDKLRTVRGLLKNSSSGTQFLDDLTKAIGPHLEKFEHWKLEGGKSLKMPKPLNLIVITDGYADDGKEVTWYLTDVAKQLDSMKAPPRQIGVQFVQVGDDKQATVWLRKLDDELGNGKVRDFIDTTPFDYQSGDADQKEFKALSNLKTTLRKIVLGAVTNEIDREANQYQSPTLGAHEIPG